MNAQDKAQNLIAKFRKAGCASFPEAEVHSAISSAKICCDELIDQCEIESDQQYWRSVKEVLAGPHFKPITAQPDKQPPEIAKLKEYADKLWDMPTIHDPGAVINSLLQMIALLPDQPSPPPPSPQTGEKEHRIIIEGNWYPAECNSCGWIGSSQYLEGCHPIADTGDHSDPLCPICGSKDVDSTEELHDLQSLVSKLGKAHVAAKYFRENYERVAEELYVSQLQPAPAQSDQEAAEKHQNKNLQL